VVPGVLLGLLLLLLRLLLLLLGPLLLAAPPRKPQQSYASRGIVLLCVMFGCILLRSLPPRRRSLLHGRSCRSAAGETPFPHLWRPTHRPKPFLSAFFCRCLPCCKLQAASIQAAIQAANRLQTAGRQLAGAGTGGRCRDGSKARGRGSKAGPRTIGEPEQGGEQGGTEAPAVLEGGWVQTAEGL